MSEKAKLDGRFSNETSELRVRAVRLIRIAIDSDPLVGVKLFKLKILSNLITYTLKEATSIKNEHGDIIRSEIKQLTESFKRNEYRE